MSFRYVSDLISLEQLHRQACRTVPASAQRGRFAETVKPARAVHLVSPTDAKHIITQDACLQRGNATVGPQQCKKKRVASAPRSLKARRPPTALDGGARSPAAASMTSSQLAAITAQQAGNIAILGHSRVSPRNPPAHSLDIDRTGLPFV